MSVVAAAANSSTAIANKFDTGLLINIIPPISKFNEARPAERCLALIGHRA